ncbi:MAG: GGDEF domain-containing protein [Nitrosomonadales bacterium]|nr:GGDEF domain-containing protein [Nitrosomonadales bacterium]
MTIPDRKLLERNKLFRDIGLENVERLLKGCQVITLKSGATLLEVGQKNTSLYLVLDGELRVYLSGRGLPVHAVLGPGECVGELSLIDGGNSAALIIAAQDTRMLVVPHELVWSMVDSSNGIARNLLAILAGRIRNDNLLQVTTSESSLEFEAAANVDALTGLHNKNWMGEAFQRMAQRCERSGVPLFLMLADIDRFKNFNDSHGHLAGDSILKGVARIMAANLRPHDLLAHLGGDRFAILLPEKSPDGALKMAGRLRESVAKPVLRFGKNSAPQAASATQAIQEEHVMVSFGVSRVQQGDTLDSVLAAAEVVLQQAKMDEHNRVKMAAARS